MFTLIKDGKPVEITTEEIRLIVQALRTAKTPHAKILQQFSVELGGAKDVIKANETLKDLDRLIAKLDGTLL